MADSRPFGIDVSNTVYTSVYFLKINPSVTIPSKWPNILYNIGIGALVRISEQASVSTNDPPYGMGLTNADTVKNLMSTTGKGVIPFINFGLSVNIKKHFRLQFCAEPTFLNFYEPGTILHYKSSSTTSDIAMGYEPIYFGVKLYYFIHSNGYYL